MKKILLLISLISAFDSFSQAINDFAKVSSGIYFIDEKEITSIDPTLVNGIKINILKNKHKEEKYETMKRNNVQKCVQWCEKYHIPYNKFLEKSNMFSQKNSKNMFTSKPASDDELNESHDV